MSKGTFIKKTFSSSYTVTDPAPNHSIDLLNVTDKSLLSQTFSGSGFADYVYGIKLDGTITTIGNAVITITNYDISAFDLIEIYATNGYGGTYTLTLS